MNYYDNLGVILLLGFFDSCSSDDVESIAISSQQAAQLESVQLRAHDVSANVIITEASKVGGKSSSTQWAITLDVSNTS